MKDYTEKYAGHPRWSSLVMLALYMFYYMRAIIAGRCTLQRHISNGGLCVCMLAVFAISWTPLRRKPTAFWTTITFLIIISLAGEIFLWDSLSWNDASMAGMLAFLAFLAAARPPFWIVCILCVAHIAGIFPVVLGVIGYSGESAIMPVTCTLAAIFVQWDWERQYRSAFLLNQKLAKSQDSTRKDKEAAHGLLTSVIPVAVLDRMFKLEDTKKESFLCECIPSGTTLVCIVESFDALYRKLAPADVVKLLNALFSHFDKLAAVHGLVPLKTVADEYIVVGNMLGEMPSDHATKVVQLAVDILSTLGKWNAEENPTNFAVQARIGIHSDSLLSGVIRTKSFVFDCWGNGIPTAEQICMTATVPNSIVISEATQAIAGTQFSMQALGELPLAGGSTLQVFNVLGNVDAAESVATEVVSVEGGSVPTPAPAQTMLPDLPGFVPVLVDYGVFQDTSVITQVPPTFAPFDSQFQSIPAPNSDLHSSSQALLDQAATGPLVMSDPQFVPIADDESPIIPPVSPLATQETATMDFASSASGSLANKPVESDAEVKFTVV
jgi:class 3 adenylate cyclase